MRTQRARFQQMLTILREAQDAGIIVCLLFTWYIMGDETPVRIKVFRPSEDGEGNLEDSATAKIMAILTSFSCVVKVVQADASVSEEPAVHIIMGELWTELRAMETQRAGVILKVYEEVGKVPEEELIRTLFQELDVMHSTDLCPGMLAMLRGHR